MVTPDVNCWQLPYITSSPYIYPYLISHPSPPISPHPSFPSQIAVEIPLPNSYPRSLNLTPPHPHRP